MSVADRVEGALLGLAVGDALGTTHEFEVLEAPPFPRMATGPLVDVVGGGPFGVAPGQVTDDTQMAVCLHESLRERGKLDAADVARRYVAWSHVAFDVGSQTAAALRRGGGIEASREVWIARGREAAGNGALMRTAPIGARFVSDGRARRRASLDDAAITHFDPRCRLACAALNGAIAAGIAGDRPDVASRFAAAAADLDESARVLAGEDAAERARIERARDELAGDLEAAKRDDPELYGPELHLHEQEGFVRVAFRLAFWELAHAPSWEAALIDVVNRGGDADTNGAIAGALVGAHRGRREIPRAWVDRVLGAPGLGPEGAYHPRVFVVS